MTRRTLVWLGSSRVDLRNFPSGARRIAGYQSGRVQEGMEPHDWKPMPSVGLGVREIRIHTELEHRVVCVARFRDAVYVLHAFEKKSRKTARRDLELARNRMRSLQAAWASRRGR